MSLDALDSITSPSNIIQELGLKNAFTSVYSINLPPDHCQFHQLISFPVVYNFYFPESHHSPNNVQFYVQHLLRKLGSNAYIGQRVILSVSQRVSVTAESLLFMDPFDDSFPKMHNCMYIM